MDIFTRAVQPMESEAPPNAVAPPIYQTSVYAFEDLDTVDDILGGKVRGYTYGRGGNPNTDALAAFVAQLEGADAATITGSGTASILAALLTLHEGPCRILLAREIYGGTVGVARRILGPLGYETEWVDTHDLSEVERALGRGPAVLVAETISNPLGRVSPLDRLADLAHAQGAPFLVDNTFATPYHARPHDFGADLVVHSLTKFIGGHSDLILGVVTGSRDRMARVHDLVDAGGFTPDPFASWLALRGGRTLAVRMERASANAQALATALEGMPGVRRVYYPGLLSHPDHAQAQRLLRRGFGAIVSVSLAGGYDAAQRLIRRLKWVRFVPSLGDVSTTLSHPVIASHRELTADEKDRVGIDPSVIRISVGIESPDDLIADFAQALDAAPE